LHFAVLRNVAGSLQNGALNPAGTSSSKKSNGAVAKVGGLGRSLVSYDGGRASASCWQYHAGDVGGTSAIQAFCQKEIIESVDIARNSGTVNVCLLLEPVPWKVATASSAMDTTPVSGIVRINHRYCGTPPNA